MSNQLRHILVRDIYSNYRCPCTGQETPRVVSYPAEIWSHDIRNRKRGLYPWATHAAFWQEKLLARESRLASYSLTGWMKQGRRKWPKLFIKAWWIELGKKATALGARELAGCSATWQGSISIFPSFFSLQKAFFFFFLLFFSFFTWIAEEQLSPMEWNKEGGLNVPKLIPFRFQRIG